MDLSDKLGLERIPKDMFPIFLSSETIIADM